MDPSPTSRSDSGIGFSDSTVTRPAVDSPPPAAGRLTTGFFTTPPDEYERTYRCRVCRKWYAEPRFKVSCTVAHSVGDCCHYGAKATNPPKISSARLT